ncbi:MAG: hypothetical protein CFK52_02830 [Chloracidobacterium sp. CP2_5A]|nr:MAG: hypothetical protein CFK52_02830 [Chloracidobacterium sp. CP2_5A]
MGDAPKRFLFFSFSTPERRRLPTGIHEAPPATERSAAAPLDLPFPEPNEVTALPAPADALTPDPAAPPEKHFNYFSYFSEIEAEFAARRGRPYRLSPLDWALIESWRKEGIPLPVVLRAIEQVFVARAKSASRQPKGRPRPVRSLSYCQPAVEEAFQAWRASRTGAAAPATTDLPSGGPSRSAVSSFLEAAATSLAAAHHGLASQARPDAPHAQLSELLPVAVAQLQALARQVASEAALPFESLEMTLSDLEDLLLAALQADAPAEAQSAAAQEAAAALKPHRRGMSAATYAEAQANYVARLLRRRYGIPRLSLFYLEDRA